MTDPKDTKEGKKLIFVVASSYKKFILFVNEMTEVVLLNRSSGTAATKDSIYKYVSDPIHLLGIRSVEVLFLPGWTETKKSEEIEEFERNAQWARMK